MTLPGIEVKFSSIDMTGARTAVDVKVYAVTDGGLGNKGQQLYNRTLLRTWEVVLPAGATHAQLQAEFMKRLVSFGAQYYPAYTASQMVCLLP